MKTAEAARAAMIEGRRGFMAHLRAGTLAEDNIGGAKLDVENTPKCTRLNTTKIPPVRPSDNYNDDDNDDDNDGDDDDFG